MSDNQAIKIDKEPIVASYDGVNIRLGEIGGDGLDKGLKYNYPEFTHIDTAIAQFAEVDPATKETLDGSGERAVMAIFNAAVKGKVQIKAKARIPKGMPTADTLKFIETITKDDAHHSLFSVEDALTYKPGERTPGIKAQIDELLKQLTARFLEDTANGVENPMANSRPYMDKIALLSVQLEAKK